MRSRDKLKTINLHYHNASGQQTSQGGDIPTARRSHSLNDVSNVRSCNKLKKVYLHFLKT